MELKIQASSSCFFSSSSSFTPRPGILGLFENIFPNIIGDHVSNDTPRNPAFCSLASFSILSLTPLISKADSPRD